MASKLKKVKAKTHKATNKRFKVSASGKIMHLGQGAGNGHSNSYKNRRQRLTTKSMRAMGSNKERIKVLRLLGK
ncbi:MAG: 50S ribosomal protein L35 [Candidatus Doudnabacteria bacterium]|nr:50S ribosomal protein L35 [Candidatus Doudnabacteria bacterium]